VSVEAIHWVLNTAPIPRDRRDASSLAMVLVSLANHADPDGRNAFPSVARLRQYTRLSERSIRYALRTLEDLGLVRPSNPDILAATIRRADRRPNGYDLALERTETPVDNPVPEGQSLPPADQHEGQRWQERGANSDSTRGRACPRNVLNRPGNRPPRERPPKARSPLPPPCGHCDARPGDPVSARLVWLDANRTRSELCPRCHPATGGSTGGGR
jgi:hypothetical protein